MLRVIQMLAAKPNFVFEVKTTGINETFALPLEASGAYDFRVAWGDDNSDSITVWNDAAVTHTYASAGTHIISISGTIQGWRFGGGGDKLKIYDIKSWGPLRLGNNNGYFWGCSNLTVSATDILNLTGMTTLRYCFRSCALLTTIPSINSWDISSINHLGDAFWEATLFDQDLSALHTSVVIYMNYTFGKTAIDQDFSSWNIASLVTATAMFHSVTLSIANYDALILSWSPQAQTIVANFHGGNSKYTGGGAVEAARDAWIAKGWTITDGGIAP